MCITLSECCTGQIMQIRCFRRREQRPFRIFEYTLHEQVRNPVRSVHVMGTTTVITGVLTLFKEFFDVQVPGFQVRAYCTFTLTTLVYRDSSIVRYFQERNNTLRLTVSPFDV